MCVSAHSVASKVDHDARPVVWPELAQVPVEDILRREMPLLHEGLQYAG